VGRRRDTRVLIVDNEPIITSTLARILNNVGYRTYEALSAEEALQIASIVTPDLLLSDVILGGISGVELAIELTKHFSACKVVLISDSMLTGTLLDDARRKGYEFETFAKPVDPTFLLNYLCVLFPESDPRAGSTHLRL
jgi:CheY-like chemotaxis protein